MGKNYYLVDAENRRALDCGLWGGLAIACPNNVVTQARLDLARQEMTLGQLHRVASKWLTEHPGATLATDATAPWLDRAGDWLDNTWVIDDPWSYAPTGRPWGHVRFPRHATP